MPSHGDDESTDEATNGYKKLALVAVINLVGFVVELAGGLLFGSSPC